MTCRRHTWFQQEGGIAGGGKVSAKCNHTAHGVGVFCKI